jgi:hypothetical protein
MAQKFRSPGSQLKTLGQGTPAAEPVPNPASGSRYGWLASRLQMLNLVLFTFGAMTCFVNYFVHHSPPSQTLYPGIGFVVMLILYSYVLKIRKKQAAKASSQP